MRCLSSLFRDTSTAGMTRVSYLMYGADDHPSASPSVVKWPRGAPLLSHHVLGVEHLLRDFRDRQHAVMSEMCNCRREQA